MKMPEAVRKAVQSARVAWVASGDADGRPHLAVSKLMRVADAEHVAFTGWFCPRTAENIAKNRRVAVAVWDPAADHGYQLIGEVTGSVVTAVANGWAGTEKEATTVPQEERKFTVRVDQVLELKAGVHTDESL